MNVQVAVNLAYSAYLSGCVDRSLLLSKKHVKDNVIFMIDEEVRPKMVHEWC